MFFSIRKPSILLPVMCLLLVFCSQIVFAQSKEWREVTVAERQMTTSKVEPNADAEAIFWEVRVDDSTESLSMRHYIRVKIFTERGREKYSKIDIPFIEGMKIKEVMARVIKADGTIVELAKTDIFEREITKTDKIKIKAKSFAVPNVEQGAIVEYRYQEVYPNSSANNMRMVFQHDIPIQNISYYFKPFQGGKYFTFNMNNNEFVKDKGGFYRATMENVPAIKEEPQMPPEDEVRSWLLFYYANDPNMSASDFWSNAGYYLAKGYDIKDTLKPSKEVKAAAEQIAAGMQTPDEKIAKIFEFCKTKIKNITFDTQITDEQKELIKDNKSTGETFQKQQGKRFEINQLFASMITALGFEARLAFGGDRSEKFFNPQQAHVSFIHFSSIAVKVGGEWKYYDPGDLFTPYGMLPWYEEDTSVLLLGSKDYFKTKTPLSGIEKSVAKRSGKFKLLGDGTLEGTVKIEYTGQLSLIQKVDNYDKSSAKREEMLKESIKERMSTAEVSDISIENVTDAEKPFTYQYKIRVPNYAAKTGKRLFLQPGFFEYGTTPLFSSATRKYPIYFHYAWSEQDNIEIELPKGFALDNAESPASINDPSNIGLLDIKITIDKTTNMMTYRRKFHFANGPYLFPTSSYEALKNLFDGFNKTDLQSITLRQN